MRSGSSSFSGAGDGSATWQTSPWPSPTTLAGRCHGVAAVRGDGRHGRAGTRAPHTSAPAHRPPVLQEGAEGRGWSGSLPDPSLLSILFAISLPSCGSNSVSSFLPALSSESTVKGPNSSQVSTQRLNWRDAWDGFSPLHSMLIILLQKSDAVPKAQADESSWSPTGLRASFQHARGSFIH